MAGLAVFAYLPAVFLHEAGGHGGSCIALGGHLSALGAYYVDCHTNRLPGWVARVVAAAGSTVNLLVAAAAFAAFRATPPARALAKLFLWLLASVNGMTWAGYFLFSGVSGVGDWGDAPDAVFAGAHPAWLWRLPLIIGGALLYVGVLRVMAVTLGGLVGVGAGARGLARAITLTAYATGGTMAVAIGLLNPVGLFITIGSAAGSSFGGTAGFISVCRWIPRAGGPGTLVLPRNWVVIGAAACAALAYALVLGPSIRFK